MKTDTASINAQIDIRATAEAAGAEFRGDSSRCPVHGGDNSTAFHVFADGKAWKCFTHENECNRYGYDGIALLRALNGWTFAQTVENYTRAEQDVNPLEAARRAAENAKRIERELQEKIEQAQKVVEELRRARRWIEYHDNMTQDAVRMWEYRGVPQDWQNYWWLGYRENFNYSYGGNFYTSPSLTIPIFEIHGNEPSQIKHRLISPIDNHNKYRLERAGIEALPFLGDRDLPIEAANRVIVVEGEIKAAVTFLTLDHVLWQVIGIPGKQSWGKLSAELQGRNDTIIMLDPDAKVDAVKMARSIGGAKVVDLPGKIDDMIIDMDLDKTWLERVFQSARTVR